MWTWQHAAAPWPRPDFLPRPVRPPALAWLCVLAGALGLAVALDDWLAVASQRGDLAREIERWQLAARPRSAARPPVAEASPAAVAAAAAITRRLEHPWKNVFESAEQRPAAGVRWLRLEHDAERGDLRLEGSAPSRDAVLQTLDALAAAPGWHDVLLLRVESGAAPGLPAQGLRFEVRAQHGGVATASEPR